MDAVFADGPGAVRSGDHPVGLRSVLPPVTLAPPEAEGSRPNSARMVDVMLGGSTNFEADRRAVAAIRRVDPWADRRVRANRAQVVHLVRRAAQHGIDQVLDLGCGLSAVGATHSVLLPLVPDARIAYVDVDPVVTHHLLDVTADLPGVTVTRGDLGRPDRVLAAPGVRGHLDLSRPVLVVASGSPHWVPGDLAAIVAGYRDALAPGSALVLSQRRRDDRDDGHNDAFDAEMARHLAPMVLRGRDEIAAALAGFELQGPGVVDVADWPTPAPARARVNYWCAVGVVPDR